MSDALWDELQRRFHAWTGNRLGRHVSQVALFALEDAARRMRKPPRECLDALEDVRYTSERDALIDRLVNRTTWFLRDAKGIHSLVEEMRKKGRTRVNVWVAGCSTGQEAYTVAMALLDAGLRPHVLATDISREALRVAARGRYRGHDLARVPEVWKLRYFEPMGRGEMRLRASVRACVSFHHHNLASAPPPARSGWDAVVCRNVLIYFEREHAVSVIRAMRTTTDFVLLSPVEQPLSWLSNAPRVRTPDDVVLLQGEPPPEVEPPRPRSSPSTRPVRVGTAATAPPPAQRSRASEILYQACDRLQKGALDDAIALCDRAIEGDELLAAAHLAKGIALKRAGRLAEAVHALRCARFLTRDEAWLAPYTLASCLERVGQSSEAAEAYRHALSIVEGGGASGLSPWDVSMEVLGRTVAESCRARLAALERR